MDGKAPEEGVDKEIPEILIRQSEIEGISEGLFLVQWSANRRLGNPFEVVNAHDP